jgi:hypothetical protein
MTTDRPCSSERRRSNGTQEQINGSE